MNTKIDDQGAYVSDSDQELSALVKAEELRQLRTVTLVASENFSSEHCRSFEGSVLADKNAEGYPGNRFAGGCEIADAIEELAISRLRHLFGCEHANVQAMSATIANVALLQAVLKPGERLLSMRLSDGGHLSHGAKFHISGKFYECYNYGVRADSGLIDMDEVRTIARQVRPKLIVCGGSSYPRNIDYALFSEIAKEVGALLWADIAHVSGLMAGKVVPSAVPHADFVTSSTHKTWRGPRGGSVVMCRKDWAQAFDRAMFPGIQGAPKLDIIASRAALFQESAHDRFKEYAQCVLINAKAMADGLAAEGLRLFSDGTDTHLILVDTTDLNLTGREAEAILSDIGVSSNKNLIPFDKRSSQETSGIRLGSAAMTTRGLDAQAFREIGMSIGGVLRNASDEALRRNTRRRLAEMVAELPLFSGRWKTTPFEVVPARHF